MVPGRRTIKGIEMKTTMLLSFIILLVLALASSSFSQEKKEHPGEKPTIAVEKRELGADAPARSEKRALLRAKVKTTSNFTGTVTAVNFVDKTITVKNHGVLVTFDADKPILKGYKGLSDVKVGHVVSVSYVETGLTVRKEGGKAVEPEVKVSKPKKETPKTRQEAAKSKPGRLMRVAVRGQGTSFDDVDENKDGRVTAVELSVIVPGLTREQFKEYDKNGDGWLDRSEFNAVRR
jgi:hypothetical protein